MGHGAVGEGEDVACPVVGIGEGGVTRSTEQLTLVVIGVGNGAFSWGGVGGNITGLSQKAAPYSDPIGVNTC